MRKTLSLLALVCPLILASATAHADREGFGVGAEALLFGPVGAEFTYDADFLRASGIIAFADDDGGPLFGDDNELLFGARVLFPVHSTASSDFSLGPGFAVVMYDEGPEDFVDVHLEAIAQIRFFVVNNVSLNASLGFAAVVGDGDDFAFGGEINGAFGVTYYFY